MSAAATAVPRRVAIDFAVMAALCLLALAPFSSAYDGTDFWVAAAGGVILGVAIAYAGARAHLGILVVAAITVLTYAAFGTALAVRPQGIAGVIPSLDSLVSLSTGVVQVWKRALTLTVPLDVFPGLAIAPLLLALVGSALAASLAARLTRAYAVALIPVAALLVASIAFGTFEGFLPPLVGALVFVLSLGWLVWRRHLAQQTAQPLVRDDAAPAPRGRGVAVAALAAVIVVAGVAGGAVAAVAAPPARQVLRDEIVPPLDVHDYASPLTLFRRYTTDGADLKLFVIDGLPAGASVRLATLDMYDGMAYVVSGGGGAGAGSFNRVGRSIPGAGKGKSVSVSVTVEGLSGVWMPTVGYLSALRFSGADAAARNSELHYNAATGTAIDIDGVRSGDTYTFDAHVAAPPSDKQLVDAKISAVTTPQPLRVPEAIGGALAEAAGDATTPSEQVRAVQAYFSKRGYFSNGLAGQTVSRAGHGLARENDLLGGKQMVGDDEQYSVAMALMLSQLGIPSRVVMGFTPPTDAPEGPLTVTAADVHAWVEVPFDGFGWVPFDPTPPKDRVPEQITEQQKQKPQGQVVQPPDVPQEPAQLPPASPPKDSAAEDQGASLAWLWTLLGTGATVLGILLALLAPTIALGWARARRRRARTRAHAAADRMSGGWAEIVDQAGDLGARLEPGNTRREHAHVLEGTYPSAGTVVLAARADAAVFGAGEVAEHEVEAYWADVATARERIIRTVPWHRRLRARLWPASGARALVDGVRSLMARLRSPRRRGEEGRS